MADKYLLQSEVSDDGSHETLLGNDWTLRKKAHTNKFKYFKVLAIFSMGLFLVSSCVYISLGVHNLQKSIHFQPSGTELGTCGESHTVEEARAQGCRFDQMSWLWVRPECYDEELINDFMNKTDWSWHTDPGLTTDSQVPLDIVFRGDHPQLFTQKKYHAIDCTYMWTKMHKALLEHRPVDTDLTNEHHTHHCNQVLLNDVLHEDVECTADMICPTLVRATWTTYGYF